MQTFCRALSRFMKPKKKRTIKNRLKRGLRALLVCIMFRSKFLAAAGISACAAILTRIIKKSFPLKYPQPMCFYFLSKRNNVKVDISR